MSAVNFEYNGNTYWMTLNLDSNYGHATISSDKYGFFTLNKHFERNAGIAWLFERDFKKIFEFIDTEYDTIMNYKKIYTNNKKDKNLLAWFKQTPIYDIQNLDLDYFMSEIV